jgi:hypothetical protein
MASFLLRRSLATRMSTSHRAATVQISTRNTSTSATYGISALSNRHETQHFHRLSRLPLMEHSPTLKLIHSSEVAPGASSAAFSSSSVLGRHEDQQEDSTPEQANLKPMQRLKDIKNEKDLSSVVAEYRKEIHSLNKRLDRHTTKLAELQQIVEKRTEDIDSESKLLPVTGGPRSKEDDEGGFPYLTEALSTIVLLIITFAALYQSGKNQGEAIYYKSLYHGQQQERNNAAPAPLNDCEYVEFENKAQIRVTVERIIDGVSDKNPHANTGTEQSDATDSDTQLGKPDRSWSSLVWKK